MIADSKRKTLGERLLPETREFIKQKIEHFERHKYSFNSPELLQVRKELNIIRSLIKQQVPELTDKELNTILWELV